MATIRRLPAVILAVVAGCTTIDSGEPPGPPLPPDLARGADGKPVTGWPASLPASEAKQRIARLLPAYVKDKAGWAGDLHAAFVALDIPQAAPTYCAAIAVIEQESSFSADPVVPGLPAIVRRELDERAGRYGIPALVVSAALRLDSPDGRSYNERIDALRTEKQLNQLFEEMIDRLPLGRRLFADYNPVRTGGPMQVSIDFAERQARERAYPYPVGRSLRDEVFTRRGGVYFGSAILLDYPAPYDAAVYRFADFNAGRYSSRNAAFQTALGRVAGRAAGRRRRPPALRPRPGGRDPEQRRGGGAGDRPPARHEPGPDPPRPAPRKVAGLRAQPALPPRLRTRRPRRRPPAGPPGAAADRPEESENPAQADHRMVREARRTSATGPAWRVRSMPTHAGRPVRIAATPSRFPP